MHYIQNCCVYTERLKNGNDLWKQCDSLGAGNNFGYCRWVLEHFLLSVECGLIKWSVFGLIWKGTWGSVRGIVWAKKALRSALSPPGLRPAAWGCSNLPALTRCHTRHLLSHLTLCVCLLHPHGTSLGNEKALKSSSVVTVPAAPLGGFSSTGAASCCWTVSGLGRADRPGVYRVNCSTTLTHTHTLKI